MPRAASRILTRGAPLLAAGLLSAVAGAAEPASTPAWLAETPGLIRSGGEVVGIDAGALTAAPGHEPGFDLTAGACQPDEERSFFFWGDSKIFGAQPYPKKMADNFVPGLAESSPGAGDGTPPGTPMRVNGVSLLAYFAKFIDEEADGGVDPDFLNPDIDPNTPGDQPYVVWNLRYFHETSGDHNPSQPQAVPGVPDELVASFVWPPSQADPNNPLVGGAMSVTAEPNQPGGSYNFLGYGLVAKTRVTFSHAPVPMNAGECWWFECAPRFNELYAFSTAAYQIGIWHAGTGGDGWMWFTSGSSAFYAPGNEQGPNQDRNWCLDIEEQDPNNPGAYVGSGTNPDAVGVCSSDPCNGSEPFNDDCLGAYELTLGVQPAADSLTCAVPVGPGEFRGAPGFTLTGARALWYTIVGDGTTYSFRTCPDPANVPSGSDWDVTLAVYCGPACDDLYYLAHKAISDTGDDAETVCDPASPCAYEQDPRLSYPAIDLPTVAGQTYYVAVFDALDATERIDLVVESDGVPVSAPADQCGPCAFDANAFGAPTQVEAEDETDSGFCVSYADDPALFEATRTNQGCQFAPAGQAYPPAFAYLNGLDASPLTGGQFVIAGTGTSSVAGGAVVADHDVYAFTVAQPTMARVSVVGAQSTAAWLTRYGWDGSDASSADCSTAQVVSRTVESGRCAAAPDRASVVLFPGELYTVTAALNDGVDTPCSAADRDYVLSVVLMVCPEVTDPGADVYDNDLVAGAADPMNDPSGCNPLIDYNAGCDRDLSEGERYRLDYVTPGELYFGNLASDGDRADVDWLAFTAEPGGEVSLSFDTNFGIYFELYELPISDCELDDPLVGVADPVKVCNFIFGGTVGLPSPGSCQFSAPHTVTGLAPGTQYALRVTQGELGVEGQAESGRPCGSGFNNYVFTWGPIEGEGLTCLGGFGGSYDTCRDAFLSDCLANGAVPHNLFLACGSPPYALCLADQTTTSTNPGDPDYGFGDGTIDGADLSYWIEQWLTQTPRGDVTSTNTNPGDAAFGVQDGNVDGADLSFFVELWLGANAGIDCVPGN